MTTDTGTMLISILPELALLALILVVLVLDIAWFRRRNGNLGWVTFIGLLVVISLSLIFVRTPEEGELVFGGMLRFDGAGFVFRILFMSGAALTVLFAMTQENLGNRGEFYILLLVSTFGMNLMASAADLIMLYLAVETTSIPLFVLSGFYIREPKSVEAGIKYLLFGAMASAVMLFGFTWLFGFTGTTQLYNIGAGLLANDVPTLPVIAAAILVLVGFSFKISIAPMHFWAPDVYDGSPTPVAGFLSTASKAAGFAILIRVFMVALPELASFWSILLGILATLSMVVGNFLALAQKNIKRLLAYSSIAQAGYILIGVASDSAFGVSSTVYYLIAYLVTNLAAFGIVTIVGKSVGSDQISSYAGLGRRSLGLAMAMLIAVLSLAGIPPFAGFVGKLLVFTAAMKSQMYWLAFVGIANAVVGLYYYLNVLKVIFLYRSENEDMPLPVTINWTLAIVLCVVGIIVVGTLIAPWFDWSSAASVSFIGY